MSVVILQRMPEYPDQRGTPGELILPFPRCRDMEFATLEQPWKDNRLNESCIPAGEYNLHWAESPSKGWCWHFDNDETEPRTHILIHLGNWVRDTKGCVLLGKWHTDRHFKVEQSAAAMREFSALMRRENFVLKIKDAAT